MKTIGGFSLNEIMNAVIPRHRGYSGGQSRTRYKNARLNGKKISKHRKVAILALGKPLPPGAIVHHIDLNPFNNEPTNLVVCPDIEYRKLLIERYKIVAKADTAAFFISFLGLNQKK